MGDWLSSGGFGPMLMGNGGDGGGSPTKHVSNLADLQKQFASQIMSGKLPPAFRTGIENQFDVAQRQAMDILPRGGQLDQVLLNLDTSRAQQISSLPAQLLPIAFGGLGQAQQAYGNLAQQQNQKKAGTGQALGKMGSAALLSGGGAAAGAGAAAGGGAAMADLGALAPFMFV